MKPIIKVSGLSKQYRVVAGRSSYATLRETITGAVRSPVKFLSREKTARDRKIWALKDVSFEVEAGAILGIIGRNGAGKSTLLKILSRITEPTAGRVELYGRASSLLEVGTGFHPELSGRENIYLNGAILGMTKTEIKRRFDEIVAFAEVEEFIETPVKHYSSGMYMRLAFAVAAHLEPEILVIDEVLAVGDVQFQKKCLGKISDVARNGRTVLFVSHNMAAVENLCQRGIVLDEGMVKYSGTQTGAIAHYLSSAQARTASLRERTDRTGSGDVSIVAIELKDVHCRPLDAVVSGQDIDLYLHFEKSKDYAHSDVIAGLIVSTQSGVPVFLQHNRLTRDEWGKLPLKGAFVCRIKRLPLPPSTYHVGYSLMRGGEYLDMLDSACELIVNAGDFYGSGEVPPITHGCCLVDAQWRLEPEAVTHDEAKAESRLARSCP